MGEFCTLSPAQKKHLEALEHRHAGLSRLIEAEQKSPAASDDTLKALKAQKLRLKDMMEEQRRTASS